MELSQLLSVKQERFDALIRCIQLYMEQDACICEDTPALPLFRSHQGRRAHLTASAAPRASDGQLYGALARRLAHKNGPVVFVAP